MRWALIALMLWLACVASLARADDVDDAAKALFERGLVLAAAGSWSEAAEALEASLAQRDRPATRFNLVLAYAELGAPLDVARHALAFLALADEPHRGDARAQVSAELTRAERSLGVLTTEGVPTGTELLVDGAAPVARSSDGRVYVLPGLHRLEARISGSVPEIIELEVGAGQVIAWPRQGHAAPLTSVAQGPAAAVLPAPEPSARQDDPAKAAPEVRPSVAPSPSRPWRTPLAWVSGLMGASLELAALGAYVGTLHRADVARDHDPTEAGFITASDRYLRLGDTITPLALSGGLLMAQAVAVGPRSARWGSRAWATSALVVAVGLVAAGSVLLLRDPDHVGDTRLDEPSRQAGVLLVSSALPFASYGLAFSFGAGRRDVRTARATRAAQGRW